MIDPDRIGDRVDHGGVDYVLPPLVHRTDLAHLWGQVVCCVPYRTNYMIIPFLVTNVINYVTLANTMAIM